MTAPGNAPDEALSIAVARHHLRKVRDIFGHLGFAQQSEETLLRFTGPRLTVLVKAAPEQSGVDYRKRAIQLAQVLSFAFPQSWLTYSQCLGM